MENDLIYDIGMNDAKDTEFYLKKGFRVVAVDADPALCAKAGETMAEAIKAGQLTILNIGVSDQRGVFDFHVNKEKSEWSSFVQSFSQRAAIEEIVQIECKLLEDLFVEYGIPYYLKVDIEGHDNSCMKSLERWNEMPQYFSTEATVPQFGARASKLGYTRFKLINQRWAHRQKLPFPAREGNYVDHSFGGTTSGAFGEETYGPWLTRQQFDEETARLNRKQFEGSVHQEIGVPADIYLPSWYDFHAAL